MTLPPLVRWLVTALVALQLLLQPVIALGPCTALTAEPGCCCRAADEPEPDERSGCCANAGHADESDEKTEGPVASDAPAAPCDCRLTPRERPLDEARPPGPDERGERGERGERRAADALAVGPPRWRPRGARMALRAAVPRAHVARGRAPLHVLHQGFLLWGAAAAERVATRFGRAAVRDPPSSGAQVHGTAAGRPSRGPSARGLAMSRIQLRPALAAGALFLMLGCTAPPESDAAAGRRVDTARAPEPVPPSGTTTLVSPMSLEPSAAELELDTTDLAACLAHGREHSTRLADAFAQWRAAAERPARVGALPEPRLSWTEFLEEIQTRTGPQERRLGISQAFPWPGTLGSRERVAERESDVLAHRVEAVRWAVERDIELAFHEYAFLGHERDITAELLALLKGLEPVVQSRVRAGAGQADLLRLQVEIGRLEDDLAALERRRPALSARLADALSLRGRGVLPMPELVEPDAPELDVDALARRALARNPGLRAVGAQLEVHAAAETVAGKARWPSFSLGVDWFQTGGAVNPNTSGSGDDPVALTLTMTLPIWTSSYRAAEREARQRALAARARVETLESELRASIQAEASHIDDAARKIELFRETLIPRADEALRLTLAAYRTGGAALLDLIDSERALLEFELSLWRARRDLAQALARLRASTGEISR